MPNNTPWPVIKPSDGDIAELLPEVLADRPGRVLIAPGNYQASKDIVINSNNTKDCVPTYIEAWAAVMDKTVVVDGFSVCIDGMSVIRAPGHGFVFLRGQGASHRKLTAERNQGDGFFFGSEGYDYNSQVAWSEFNMLCARFNEGHGVHVHGASEINRSWLNANHFSMLALRENKKGGFKVTEGTPTTKGSRVNYNQFSVLHSERNGEIVDMTELRPRANTLVNPHIVEKDSNGDSLKIADVNFIVGGRIVGDIPNKTRNTINSNTGTFGEASRFSYDPDSDLD